MPIGQHLRDQSVDLPTDTDLMLINPDIGLLLVEDLALANPAVVAACKEATAIIVNSQNVHYRAYNRRNDNKTWTSKDPHLSTPEAWAKYPDKSRSRQVTMREYPEALLRFATHTNQHGCRFGLFTSQEAASGKIS
jgi:hypothetical protein